MKIIAVCGSPRKGNSDFLARKFLETAEKLGAGTEMILLREKKIAECIGCDDCWGANRDCHIKDDMGEIIQKMLESDLIIFATPNYFDNVSGLMKIFIDRTNSLADLKDKKAFTICVGGQPIKPSIKKCNKALENYIKIRKMQPVGSFLATADKLGEIEQKPEIVKKLERKARKIVKNLQG